MNERKKEREEEKIIKKGVIEHSDLKTPWHFLASYLAMRSLSFRLQIIRWRRYKHQLVNTPGVFPLLQDACDKRGSSRCTKPVDHRRNTFLFLGAAMIKRFVSTEGKKTDANILFSDSTPRAKTELPSRDYRGRVVQIVKQELETILSCEKYRERNPIYSPYI